MLRQVTIVGAAALAVSGCGDTNSADERIAGAYAAVVQAVADEGPGPFSSEDGYEDRVVYAGPLHNDVEITLEIQVEVVDLLRADDYATVRFVDTLDEAVLAGEEGEPVLEDGVLVLLGEVPDDDTPTVAAQRYLEADEYAAFTAQLEESDESWSVAALEPAEWTEPRSRLSGRSLDPG